MLATTNRARVSNEQMKRDIEWIESLWKPIHVGQFTLNMIDRGSGVPLVFVPVFTGSEFMYTSQLRTFEHKCRVILYRRRESITASIGLHERVAELKAFLDVMNLQQVHLSAHSDGAMVAIAFAAKYPERVLSMSLFCVADKYRIPPQPFMQMFLNTLEKFPIEYMLPDRLLQRLLAYYGGSNSGFTHAQLYSQTSQIQWFSKFFKYSMLPLLLDYDGTKLAPQVHCPVLLIHHRSKDRIIKTKQIERLSNAFPLCSGVKWVSGGGHMFTYCAADEVNVLMEQFYDDFDKLHSTPSSTVLELTDERSMNPQQVGKKACVLAQLKRHQLPIPNGFCLTPGALTREFLRWNVSSGMNQTSMEQLVESYSFSSEFIQTVQSHFRKLKGNKEHFRVAVRSSSTLEDLGDASFAGQYETVLDVRDESKLIDAIKTCLLSYWTPRATTYRDNHGIHDEDIHMGILVQEMVHSTTSGVLFTKDPRSNHDDTLMVVNAVWGLGESLVSGAVTPDEYIINRTNGAEKHSIIADKKFKLQSSMDGGVESIQLNQPMSKGRVLSNNQLELLASLGNKVEQIFQSPQDLEWAFQDGELYLLQSRPITTLKSKWIDDRREKEYLVRWGSLIEWGNIPISPFTNGILERLRLDQVLSQMGIYLPKRIIKIVNGYVYSPVKIRFTWKWIMTPVKLWRTYKQLHQQFDEDIHYYLERIDPHLKADLNALSEHQLLQMIKELSDISAWAFENIIIKYYGICLFAETYFSLVYRAVTGNKTKRAYIELMQGSENKSLFADLKIWELCHELKQYNELREAIISGKAREELYSLNGASEFFNKMKITFDDIGHRLTDLDISCPTPKDDYQLAISIVRMITLSNENTLTSHARKKEIQEEKLQAILKKLHSSSRRRRWFIAAYERAKKYNVIREDRPFYLGMIWNRLREVLLRLGELLASQQRLAHPSHIFYLNEQEIKHCIEGQNASQLAFGRFKAWEGYKHSTPVDEINPPSIRKRLIKKANQSASRQQSSYIQGISGSPGCATGRVRIIKEAKDFSKLSSGEIIVAPSTTPAWTVLFGVASAIITDVGGSLSHAAIVAREYGIPAVLGTDIGTLKLKDGDYVRVDGTSGTVNLVKEE